MRAITAIRAIGRAMVIVGLLTAANSLNAHTPHHTIDALEILSSAKGSNVYIVRGGWQLFTSSDQGLSWRELSRGLTSRYQYTALAGVVQPDGTQSLFIGSDGDGVFGSADAGKSWQAINDGLSEPRIRQLLVSARRDEAGLVFALTQSGELFVLPLGTERWQKCRVPDQEISIIARSEPDADHRSSPITLGTADGELWAAVNRCDDWQRLVVLPFGERVTAIHRVPTADHSESVWLLGTHSGKLYSSSVGGSVAELNGFPAQGGEIRSINSLVETSQQRTLLVSTWDQAIFRSADGGVSWSHASTGLSTHAQANSPQFFSPQFRDIRVAEDQLFLAGFDGLFRSADTGRSWRQLVTEPAGNLWSLSLSPSLGSGHVVAVTTFGAGAYLKNSTHRDWHAANRGHGIRRLRELAFSPDYQNDQSIFTTQDEGDYFLRSNDGGNNWSVQQFDRGWYIRNKIRVLATLHNRYGFPEWMTLDLITDDERRVANPKGLVLSPEFAQDQQLFISTRYHGNYESSDSGLTLNRTSATAVPIWETVASPSFPEDGTLFGSAREQGVFRSNDGGESWQPINQGLEFLAEWASFLQDAQRASVELSQSMFYDLKLAISPDYKHDSTLFMGGGPGFFRSTDQGLNWTATADLQDAYVLAMTVSPEFAEDRTILVSLKGLGLWESQDAGRSFSRFATTVVAHNHEIRHLKFSPDYISDGSIYAASQEYVFVSEDRGQTWREIDRPVRYETGAQQIVLNGDWQRIQSNQLSGGSAHQLVADTGEVTFRFVGTGVRGFGEISPSALTVGVYVNGELWPDALGQHANQGSADQIMAVSQLPFGEHEVTIRAENSGGNHTLIVDAFEVLGHRKSAFAPL